MHEMPVELGPEREKALAELAEAAGATPEAVVQRTIDAYLGLRPP